MIMGRGRTPCCDKSQVQRGPWSPSEDLKLITFVQKHGHLNWRALPKQAGLYRCGKSCRLRWVNYLRPDLKRGDFTKEEEEIIIRMHAELGNKWSKIASQLPGRTDNDIKNMWNTHLKKRVQASTTTESGRDESKGSSLTSSSLSTADTSDLKSKNKSSPSHQMKGQVSTETGQDAAGQDSLEQVSDENVETVVELKELSSSVSSHFDVTDIGLFENYRSLQQLTPKVSGAGPYFMNKVSEEVNKTDISETKNVKEQPLEVDLDFWAMLENIGSYQSKGVQFGEVTTSQPSSFGEVSCHEYENRKWSHYFDHELSLGTVSSKHPKLDQSEPNNAAEPNLYRPQIHHGFHFL